MAGEFGVVYKGHLVQWNGEGELRVVAVKTLKGLFTPTDVQSLVTEVIKMQQFDHRHVMPLIGVCLDAGPGLALILPYMANGNLLDYLRKDRSRLLLEPSESTDPDTVTTLTSLLLRICFQIALGMKYLTKQKIIHRDLAARNCLLDGEGNIKVSDFGLSEDIYVTGWFRQTESRAIRLPFKWMALESIVDGLFSERSDVWSFGVTCWEVFSGGKIPYPTLSYSDLVTSLKNGGHLSFPENMACNETIYTLMKQCWNMQSYRRPTFSQLVSSLSTMLECSANYTLLGDCIELTLPPLDCSAPILGIESSPILPPKSLVICNPSATDTHVIRDADQELAKLRESADSSFSSPSDGPKVLPPKSLAISNPSTADINRDGDQGPCEDGRSVCRLPDKSSTRLPSKPALVIAATNPLATESDVDGDGDHDSPQGLAKPRESSVSPSPKL